MKLSIYDAKELNFVELNSTGGNETYIRCDKESKYLDSIVFSVFAPCFEIANKLYEYYGPTKYNARKIIPLRNELLKYLEKLESSASLKLFKELLGQHFLGREFMEALDQEKPGWENEWKSYLSKLIVINKEMISLAEKCADEEKILWIVGY
ncbi:MAG: hypothetical protein EHM20_02935 [Alphaproteobacteria bacterium]|nr:MAG: hypothetical protein EHM20_02935 [Alphaproteobacteria bacterium]